MDQSSTEILLGVLHFMNENPIYRDRARGVIDHFLGEGSMICDDGRVWVQLYAGYASDIECEGLVDRLHHHDLLEGF